MKGLSVRTITKWHILTCLLATAVALATGGTPIYAAQAPASGPDRHVEGMVVDPQGLPVAGARLTLVQRPGGLRKSVLSTASKFSFDGLAAGLYDLQVEAGGFETKSTTVD